MDRIFNLSQLHKSASSEDLKQGSFGIEWEGLRVRENGELSLSPHPEIFGNKFTKQFPKEGSEYIQYDENYGKYITTGIGLDMQDDMFYIKKINKTKDGYEVEIVEYLEDYENAMELEDENEVYDIYIKNLKQETVATIKSNESETRAIEVVKENIDKFTTKKVKLVKNSEAKIFVESVE